ncbi:ATP-binding protein [Microbacterium sp. NPDC078428]|uniref:sensor histidine kinase n=1 Tax=Microbacterium sp. NPDC078428 TaxID=3364190 RepID=UPI0037CC8208
MSTIHDAARRDAIAAYRLIDDAPSPDLERLVRLAASICGVSTAVINVIDDRWQHQIAAVGFEPALCEREDSMCAAVLSRRTQVSVRDARLDERFAANPFVTGEIAHIRFYAASPLTTPQGITIGTLCVFDEEPGELSPQQSADLALLADQVVELLELRRVSAELARSNEQLAAFAAQVSHDLRNPLTALAGFLELASGSPEMAHAPHAAEALARAEAAADRMTTMVDDLLEYARVGGAVSLCEEVRLDAVTAAVLEDLGPEIRASGADVTVDADLPVRGDETQLRALVQNLVANAVKFASVNGDAPRVTLTATPVDGAVRMSVDDNGPGVPASDRERVFALMARGTDDHVPGLGIGLSTCRRIVQAHGGTISIDDSPLGGARVSVVLPG